MWVDPRQLFRKSSMGRHTSYRVTAKKSVLFSANSQMTADAILATSYVSTARLHALPVAPKASVIVVTYNNDSLLEETLRSLERQTISEFEILILDNNDSIDIADTVSRYAASYIKLKRNFGVNVGRNVGAAYASSEIVIFLDDDAIVPADFVAAHIHAHLHLGIYGLRGKCIPKTKSIYNALAQHYDLGEQIVPFYNNLEGNSSYNRGFLLSIGGFAPKLWGHEGIELTARAVETCGDAGRFIYYPEAVIYHDYADSFRKYFKKVLRHTRNARQLIAESDRLHPFIMGYSKLSLPQPPRLSLPNRIQLRLLRKFTNVLVRLYLKYERYSLRA
jgi:glycosyltransferase involved in cell wall biosynthesis